jgi:hypothetical protein
MAHSIKVPLGPKLIEVIRAAPEHERMAVTEYRIMAEFFDNRRLFEEIVRVAMLKGGDTMVEIFAAKLRENIRELREENDKDA